MINLRKAVAITATGALAAVGLATGAGAQTATVSSSVITTTLVATNVPAGVAGYRIDIECSNLQGTTGNQTLTATYGTAGGSVGLPFGLQPTTTGGGSSCIVRATPTGTGNLLATVPTIRIGGTLRAVTVQATPVVAGSATFATALVPITSATDVVVTFTYPSLIVKKTVNGDELTAGYDYPMIVRCFYADGVEMPNARQNNVGTAAAGTGFNGNFTLKKDATRTFGISDFPFLATSSRCNVAEGNSGGASVTSFSSTQPANADGTAAPLLIGNNSGGTVFNGNLQIGDPTVPAVTPAVPAYQFQSASTLASAQTVTVTNSFVGDFIISKVVTGDPKTNIAVYEVSVACDKGGPKETFLLKDRQSKIYTNIASGTNCLVTETRSDGATASYADNSGDNITDGRVTIKATASGCIDTRLAAFPDCRANVIVTNDYNVLATTTTAAPATTVAAATTAAPAVDVAPPTAVVEEPTFTG